MRSLKLLSGGVLLGIAVLAGCGRQVEVTPPSSTPTTCTAVKLPQTVAGAGRLPTTPSSPATAAWGDPPITWRCGIDRPASLSATSSLVNVAGISWLQVPASGGSAFVTVDWPSREEAVYAEVLIPDAYAEPAAVLADLSPPLSGAPSH